MHSISFRLTSCHPEGDRSIWKVLEVRLCETLLKTDRYDFMRLDSFLSDVEPSSVLKWSFSPACAMLPIFLLVGLWSLI